MNTSYVTASELGDYVYCECCWADKLEGNTEKTEAMVQGTALHDRLQWLYESIQFLRQVAIVLVIGGGILLALFAIILYITGNLI